MATTRTGKLSELTPDHSNANRGTERGRYALEASLRKYGAGRSILIDRNGRIIAGNKTAETAADVGIDDVIVVQTDGRQVVAVQRTDLDLDSNEARELAYADNRVGQLDLDFDPAQILADLNAGVNLDQFWRKDELDELLADLQPKTTGDTPAETDRAEELRQKWGVKSGDLWSLDSGNGHGHRLVCGDCTDAATVARVMGGERAQGVFTSPPYAEQRKEAYGGIPEGEYLAWWANVQSEVKRNLAQDGSFFVNIKEHSEDYIRSTYVHELAAAMVAVHGWVYLDEFCWERVGIPGDPGKMGKFKNQWEPVFWWARQARPKFHPSRVMHESNATIQDENFEPTLAKMQGTGKSVVGTRKIGKGMAYPGNRIRTGQNEAMDHPAAFPVDLPSFFIRAFSDEGDIWLEPFSGSGTVIIACENLARRARACEISPAYVAVALERWSVHTGRQPVLVEGAA